jgi:hypothetical protein
MKMLFISMLLLQTVIGIAQNIKITVLNKNSQPMPYAYILINGKPVEVTDSMGMASIPADRIHIKDTISVKYLGAYPKKVVFDERLQREGSFFFYLDEREYLLNDVTVTYENYVKLFKKSTRTVQSLNYECNLDARLEAKIFRSDKLYYSGSGTIRAFNSRERPRLWGWFSPEFKYITESDTSNIWSELNFHLHWALNHPYLCLWSSRNEKKVDGIYSFLGENDSLKIFRIVYPKTWFKGLYYQVMFFVDKESRYIKSAEIIAYTDDTNKNNTQLLNIKLDYILFRDKKHREMIYLPNNIEYNIQTSNTSKLFLWISDTNLR